MRAYYNEHDKFAAQTLRNLIAAGELPDGDVDERSIIDVRPGDLTGYTQAHWFAGIGIWPKALRDAGVPDDAPIWTGSCPCQPFSQAGKGGGFDDERHLWPAWHWLISQCRPTTILGEQVASPDGLGWFDLVSNDLEASGYACGAVDLGAAGVGGPHVRQRLWFVGMADADLQRESRSRFAEASPRRSADGFVGGGSDSRMADAHSESLGGWGIQGPGQTAGAGQGTSLERPAGLCGAGRPGTHDSPWGDADWLYCRDDKWRPVEPGTQPLAYGLPRGMGTLDARLLGLAEVAGLDGASLKRAKSYRVGALKGYGNALCLEAATTFVRAAMDAISTTGEAAHCALLPAQTDPLDGRAASPVVEG